MSTRKIVTSHDYPPIPIRSMDWSAWFDGDEERGECGYGATEAEAVADLIVNHAEDHEVVRRYLAYEEQTPRIKPDSIELEAAGAAAFRQAQSVYRGDHDHFPLKTTWETTDESVREGWRKIAAAALSAGPSPSPARSA